MSTTGRKVYVHTPGGQVIIREDTTSGWDPAFCGSGQSKCSGCGGDALVHINKCVEFCQKNNYPKYLWSEFYFKTKEYEELLNLLQDPGDPPSTDPMPGYSGIDLGKGPVYFPKANKRKAKSADDSPVICKKCNMKNDFGAPNQKDGSYICYVCR